jgi:predicted amidohydrolase YtcJ
MSADKNLSRKGFLKGAAALGIGGVAALGAGAASGAGSKAVRVQVREAHPEHGKGADVALINGKIHTFDDANPIVSEVLIENGRFTLVGNPKDKAQKDKKDKITDRQVEVIDLKGRTVVPGLIEGHVHIVSLANRPGYHVVIENAKDIAGIQALLAARRPDVPAGQFITAMGGWSTNMFAERRLPTLAELDAAVSDRPVFVYQGGGGPAVTNTLGKAFFESQSDTQAGPVTVSATGAIATGNPNMANRALYFLRKLQTAEDKERGAVDAMAYCAQVGLTACLDQVLPPATTPLSPTQGLPNLDQFRMYDGWLAAHRNGKSLIRLQTNFLHDERVIELPQLKERLKNTFPLFGDEMMMTGAIGEWGAAGDGVGPVWLEAQKLIAAAGWRNTNRNLSLSALQAELAGYQQITAMGYDITGSGLRWTLHHLNAATATEIQQAKAMGIGVQAGAWRYGSATNTTTSDTPFRTIVDSGIQAGIHLDGVHIAPLNPWFGVYYASTGVSARGDAVNVAQKITREEALRLYTRENAWHLSMEDDLGSVEVG